MNTSEHITELKDLELYKPLMKKGLISLSINYWYEIYQYYQTRLIVNNEFENSKMLSYEETEESFNCSETTIRRAIKYMES